MIGLRHCGSWLLIGEWMSGAGLRKDERAEEEEAEEEEVNTWRTT